MGERRLLTTLPGEGLSSEAGGRTRGRSGGGNLPQEAIAHS